MGELVGGLREGSRGAFRSAGSPREASVRWRMVENVSAEASAPPATELAARSSWRIIPPSSSSSSPRICLAVSPLSACGASGAQGGFSACGRRCKAVLSGNDF